jgi:hypothetical protein
MSEGSHAHETFGASIHTSTRLSLFTAPTWLTVGGSRSAGSGTEITTFCSSNSFVASYSIETYDSSPEVEGQQLMDSGTMLSSVACERFTTKLRGSELYSDGH